MAKVLAIVSYKIFPAHMGGQKGIVHFYDYLRQHHSVSMAVSGDNEVAEPSYRVERILYANRRIVWNLFSLGKLKKIVKEQGIDVIIAEHSYTGWIAWLLKLWTGKPFIIHSHNIESSRFRQMGKNGWKWYAHYERWIHRKADFTFFKTEEDRNFAVKAFSLPSSKCSVVPYGVSTIKRVANAEQKLRMRYNISNRYILYFNGTLDYTPNAKAVERIIDSINPLLQASGIDFVVLISGKNLSPGLLRNINQTATIRYLHYVDDIEMVYQATTIFINPVMNNAGVKTKLVEALANSCTVVSTLSGATGIPKELCGEKLVVTEDGNWKLFAEAIVACLSKPTAVLPLSFNDYFSWRNITRKAAVQIEDLSNHG